MKLLCKKIKSHTCLEIFQSRTLGILSKVDDDGSESVSKKIHLRSLIVSLWTRSICQM